MQWWCNLTLFEQVKYLVKTTAAILFIVACIMLIFTIIERLIGVIGKLISRD